MSKAFCIVALLLASVPARLAVVSQDKSPQWQASDGPYVGAVVDIAVSRTGAIFAATSHGLRRSSDDGISWSECAGVTGSFARVLGDGRLLVGPSPTGVLTYLDEGCRVLGDVTLPADFNSPKSIHALLLTSTGRLLASRLSVGLFLSDDNGLNWRRATLPSAPKEAWVLAMAALPSGHLVAAAQGRLLRSTDNGDTWFTISSPVVPHALTLDSTGALLAANGDGTWRSIDEGETWQRAGLQKQHVWTVLSAKSGVARADDVWFAALSPRPDVDNVVSRSADRGARWTETNSGLKGRVNTLAITPRGALIAGSSAGFFRSADEGRSWVFRGVDRAPLRVVASGPGFIVSGGPGAWRSTDGGSTWERMLVYLNEGYARAGIGEEPRAFAAVSGGRLVAGVANGVAVSIDRGTIWTRSGLWHHTSSLLELSDGSILAGTTSGIFRSTDGGMKWIEQSVGLSEFDVRAIAVLASGELVAATLRDVCMSTDNGKNWHLTKTGLPRTARPGVLPSGRGSVAVVGTDRGVYQFDTASGAWKLAVSTASPVLSLGWDADERLWVGTAAHGVSILRHRPDKWLESSGGLAGHEVLAIAVIPPRSIVVTTSRGTFRAALP